MFDFVAQSLLLFKGNWVMLTLSTLPFPFSNLQSSVTCPVCMCMLFSSLGIIFFFIFSPSDIGLRNNRNIRAMAAIHSRLQVHHTYYGNACACERACMYVLVEFWLPVTTIKMTLTQT